MSVNPQVSHCDLVPTLAVKASLERMRPESSRENSGRLRSRLAFALIGLLVVSSTNAADPAAPDTARLQLSLPPGATATLDSLDIGDNRSFNFRLKGNDYVERKLAVRFPGVADEVERTILLKAGWRVGLTIPHPNRPRVEVVPQTGHPKAIEGFAISPDGRLLASADTKTCLGWEVATGRLLRRFASDNPNGFKSVAFSRDSKYLAAEKVLTAVVVWDLATGREVGRYSGQSSSSLGGISFNDAGNVLIWKESKNELLHEWNPSNGKVEKKLSDAPEWQKVVSVSANGKYALSKASLALVKREEDLHVIWEVATGKRVCQLEVQDVLQNVRAFVFAPDGSTIAGYAWSGTDVYLWDAKSGKRAKHFETGKTYSLAFADDSKELVTVEYTAIRHWDVLTGKCLRTRNVEMGDVGAAALTPDGSRVLVHDFNREHTTGAVILSADVRSGEVKVFSRGTPLWPRVLRFSSDGSQLLIASDGGRNSAIELWDFKAGRPRWASVEKGARFPGVAFLPNGNPASLLQVRRVDLHSLGMIEQDALSGRLLRSNSLVTIPVKQPLDTDAVFSGDGSHLLVWGGFGTHILDTAPDKKPRKLEVTSDSGKYACLNGDGKVAAIENQDRHIEIWDTFAEKRRNTLKPVIGKLEPVTLSLDGKLLVAYCSFSLELWDAQASKLIHRISDIHARPGVAAITPDCRFVAYNRGDNSVVVWDVREKKERHVLRGHFGWTYGMAISPDGRILATGADDGTLRLWDLATGDELATLFGFGDGRNWLAVSPTGLFDGSAAGRDHVLFREGRGLGVLPANQLFNALFRPGLLTVALEGEAPSVQVDLVKSRPPSLRLISPKPGTLIEQADVDVEVEIIDEGGGVKGPSVFQNGTKNASLPTTAEAAKGRKRMLTVALSPGLNDIEIRAASADGLRDSEPLRFSVTYRAPVVKPVLYVLAVGVNAYARDSMKLKYAASDAQAIVDVFKARAAALYQRIEPVALLDDKATRENIEAAFKQFARAARPQDTLVVFFAGHGMAQGERYYFLPADFSPRDGVNLEIEVQRLGLPGDVLHDWARNVGAGKRLMIFDTCHSGAALPPLRRDAAGLRGAIERLGRSNGVYMIAAAPSGEEAKEPKELGHGILTYSLLAGLRAVKAGPLKDEFVTVTDSQGVINVLDWFSFASVHSRRLTKLFCEREQDIEMSSEGRNFPLLTVEK